MYPSNRPNIFNQPKKRDPLSLKEGRYFWLSSIMKTYNKEQQASWQIEKERRMSEMLKSEDDSVN